MTPLELVSHATTPAFVRGLLQRRRRGRGARLRRRWHRDPLVAGARRGVHLAGHVDGLQAGAHYGYRVHGPNDPASGARCNPAKLLLDPYARAISGAVQWDDALERRQPHPLGALYAPLGSLQTTGLTGAASDGRTLRWSTR